MDNLTPKKERIKEGIDMFFKQKYLIRLDDACPTMDSIKWCKMEALLSHYGVKPMIGVIPNNEDPLNIIETPDSTFWNKVQGWQSKGWTIAMHGYNHVYNFEGLKGLYPLWKESEFVGVPLDEQRNKIRKGVEIMRSHGIDPIYFFAPSHTFDNNTLVALRDESNIQIISDMIAAKPFKWKGFVFIPQQSGHPIKLPFGGVVTICYHPNTMPDEAFEKLESFLNSHQKDIISFDKIDISKVNPKSLTDKCLSWLYFFRRRVK